jgi:hypothetical protein
MVSRLVYCVLKFIATNGREFDALWNAYQRRRSERRRVCSSHVLPKADFWEDCSFARTVFS